MDAGSMRKEQSLLPITVACPHCDLLNRVPPLAPGDAACCVRCNATLSRNPRNSIERGLALTCTAIILFLIANIFPFLSFGMEGIVTHTTLGSGIKSLYAEHMYFLAAVVAFATIVVPTVILTSSLYILLPLRMNRRLPGAEQLLRWTLRLGPWNMVEIFMLGIIMAAIKLHKMAALVPGLSAWAFVALIFTLTVYAATWKTSTRISQQLLATNSYDRSAGFRHRSIPMTEITIPADLPPWIKTHIELYLKDGDAAHMWDARLGGGKGMLTTLLLTTTGRKSGKKLMIPLIYRPTDDDGFCVIASKGGAPAHPAWFLNLEANPRVHLKIASKECDAIARVAEGAEREQLWKRMVEYYAPYTDYQAATKRKIPVVVFNPVKD